MSTARRTRDAGSPVPLFAALGDETRLALVRRLCSGGPASITGLARGGRVTRQAVAKHLAVLSRAGLVESSRRGRERIWTVDTARLLEAGSILDKIGRQWDAALARLQKHVEAEQGHAVR